MVVAGDGMADQGNEPTREEKTRETERRANHSDDLAFYKIGAQWLLYDSHPGNDSSNQACARLKIRDLKK